MQNHYIPCPIDPGYSDRQDQALWSRQPDGTLYLFVHGFNGHASNTWTMFPTLLKDDLEFSKSDIIFYGYDSRTIQARVNATRLYDFLNSVWTRPGEIISRSLGKPGTRPDSFAYNRLLIVAHSLGAVLARQALLDAYRTQQGWSANTRLILFSPAHMGSNLLELLKETFGRFVPTVILSTVIQHRWQVLRDLEPGSDFLKALQSSTNRMFSGAPTLAAKTIVHCLKETVVSTNDFILEDPPPILVENRTHVNICKPDPAYLEPVNILKDASA